MGLEVGRGCGAATEEEFLHFRFQEIAFFLKILFFERNPGKILLHPVTANEENNQTEYQGNREVGIKRTVKKCRIDKKTKKCQDKCRDRKMKKIR